MTRLLMVVALVVLATTAARAAEPVVGRVTVAARLVHDGIPADGAIDIRVSLFAAATGGTSLWSEDHAGVAAVAGLAAFEIGDTQPLTTVILDGSSRWLEIEVDGQRLSPRLAITSVPYALRAERAGQVGNLGEADIQRRVAMACSAGQTIAGIAADGSVACSGYTGANGVTVTGTQIAADPNILQRRVASACPTGQSIRAINGDGSVNCEIDDNTTYTAGQGILIDASNRITPDFNLVQPRIVPQSCFSGNVVIGVDTLGDPVCAPIPVTGATSGLSLDSFRRVRLGAQVTLSVASSSTTEATDVTAATFCALTSMDFQTADTGTFHHCSLTVNAGSWTLHARGGSGATVRCEATCL